MVGRISRIVTARASPGSAPSTQIGPGQRVAVGHRAPCRGGRPSCGSGPRGRPRSRPRPSRPARSAGAARVAAELVAERRLRQTLHKVVVWLACRVSRSDTRRAGPVMALGQRDCQRIGWNVFESVARTRVFHRLPHTIGILHQGHDWPRSPGSLRDHRRHDPSVDNFH